MQRRREAAARWWGEYPLHENETGCWRIGGLRLWATRRPAEWRVAYRSSNDPHEDELAVEVPCAAPPPAEGVELARFAMERSESALRLLPRLPDRPVVSRPDTPFYVLAGEEIRLFVSSPVWVHVLSGERELLEIPIYRPSDTWFGPSTREGEVCYASWTSGRTELAELPRRPHRAVATVRVENHTEKSVLVERLNIPVPYLALYAAADGSLWTQGVTLRMVEDGATAEIHIAKEGPPEAPGATRLADPREDADRNLLVRALSALIG